MGLDVYLYSKAEAASEDYAHEDVPSEKYPDHLIQRDGEAQIFWSA